MREIEFRGKTSNGEWVYGGYIQSEQVICPQTASVKIFIDPETVAQYTERKDKNGVKIFRNDIVKFSNKDIAVICWFKDSWQFDFLWGFAPIGNVDDVSIEVIGNIHDNSELLEVRA